MSKRQLRSRAPRPADAFIEAATAATRPGRRSHLAPPETLPWTAPAVRRDLRLPMNTRLPEDLLLKIDFVSERTGKLKQELVEEALGPWLRAELEKLGVVDEDEESPRS